MAKHNSSSKLKASLMVANYSVNFSINISLQCSIDIVKFNARQHFLDLDLGLALALIKELPLLLRSFIYCTFQ